MTITIMCERSLDGKREATVEYEKFCCYYARVYELYSDEWHQTHESHPTKDPIKAKASCKRFIKKYL